MFPFGQLLQHGRAYAFSATLANGAAAPVGDARKRWPCTKAASLLSLME